MAMTGCFYLVDCLLSVMVGRHTELPFYERGVYAGGPYGFLVTIVTFFGTIFYTLKSTRGYPSCSSSAEKKSVAGSPDAFKDSQEKSPASLPVEKQCG